MISVIIAVKNEEKYIERCLQSVIGQDFPKDKYNIVVVDGNSNDNTLKIAKSFQEKYPKLIKIYKNPKEWQSAGRNLGIQNEPQSELIAYIDGHCIADKMWLRTLYDEMNVRYNQNVVGIGSTHKSPIDESLLGKGIEQVFQSLIGGIGSSYRRKGNNTKEVLTGLTARFLLYKRPALEKVGLYDEDLKYGEDFALNYKLMKAGYKIIVSPKAIVYYYKRKTFYSFFKQMYNYGVAKAIVGKKYPGALKVVHILPAIILIFFASLAIASVFLFQLRLLVIILVAVYTATIFVSSMIGAYQYRKILLLLIMPILYIEEHFSYAFGFIHGLFKKGWKK